MPTTRYTSLANTPIADDNFAGLDVRYSSEFEDIESAIGREGSIHANSGPDWQQVAQQCETLLMQQSRDLRVICWFIWSLYRSEGMAGLLAGLGLLNASFAHWEVLHPQRPATRAGVLNWLVSRLENAIPALLIGPASNTDHALLHEQLSQLDQQLQNRLGDKAPLLQPLCRQVRTRAETQNTASAAPATRTDKPATSQRPTETPVPVSSAPSPELIVTPRDAHKALRALQEQSRTLCHWWQSQSVTDARAISLSRTLLWLPIESIPEHDDTGKTGLRGLPADRLQALQERLNQHQPDELLRDIESSIARAPFWLDGQYLAWRCLEELKAETAQQELEQQLNGFLRRLPGIENLQFFDGTPFADAQTLGWISSHIRPANTNNSPITSDAATEAPWESAFNEAQAQLRNSGLKAALHPIQTGINSTTGRTRMHWQLVAARLCLQAGKHDAARHMLEGLDQQLQTMQLAHWEPQLLTQTLQLLLKSYDLAGRKANHQRRDDIFQRLCHLDFEVVLEQALGP